MTTRRHLKAVEPGRRRVRTLTFPELFDLPVTVDMATAARAFGISLGTAYRLAGRGAFPCAVMRPTWRYRISTAVLMRALGIDAVPVDPRDVEAGAAFASRVA